MVPPLQTLALDGVGGLVIAFVVAVGVVAFGTYVGVLTALQSVFDSPSWEAVQTGTARESDDAGETGNGWRLAKRGSSRQRHHECTRNDSDG